ncbi:hypothetical protein [Streptomyces xanthophaeus]
MRETSARAGDTLAGVSAGLQDLVTGGSRSHTAASTSELSKMLSGKRSFRPAVITGLHTLVDERSGPSYDLRSETDRSMRLFHGWLEVRDPARLRVLRLEEELLKVEGSRREAEKQARLLTERLDEVRAHWDVGWRRLVALTGDAVEGLSGRKEEIAELTRVIEQIAWKAEALEEALRSLWQDIRGYTLQAVSILADISVAISQLVEDQE